MKLIAVATDDQDAPLLGEQLELLWYIAASRDAYDEQAWLELAALAPVLELRTPGGTCMPLDLVLAAVALAPAEREARLVELLHSLRTQAAAQTPFDQSTWNLLETRLLGTEARESATNAAGEHAPRSRRERSLEKLRDDIRGVVTAVGSGELEHEGGVAALRELLVRGEALRGSNAWLRWQLAILLEVTGDLDESTGHAEEACNLDPTCPDFADLRERLRAAHDAAILVVTTTPRYVA